MVAKMCMAAATFTPHSGLSQDAEELVHCSQPCPQNGRIDGRVNCVDDVGNVAFTFYLPQLSFAFSLQALYEGISVPTPPQDVLHFQELGNGKGEGSPPSRLDVTLEGQDGGPELPSHWAAEAPLQQFGPGVAPTDEATTRLRLAHIFLEVGEDVSQALRRIVNDVMQPRG